MAKLGILPDLTKKYILERLTQEEIMEYYTNILVTKETLVGNSFTSPFRQDDYPTCNYYYKQDSKGEVRLKLKDWNGSFDGDIFDIASYVTKVSSKTGQGFKLLLHKIARDFSIHKYSLSQEREKLDNLVKDYISKKELKVLKVHPRGLNRFDKKYWYDKFGIGSELLKIARIIPVQSLEIQGQDGYLTTVYNYQSRDPAYAYYGGIVNGITIWRIYFPLREKTRAGNTKFITNYSFIQGLHLIKPARVGIITKSYKDALCLRTYNIEAIGVPSETYLMTKEEFFNFKINFDVVFTNFDYDRTGIRLANKYKRVHGCLPLMFTKGKHNQINYGVKDFSEFREQYGHIKMINLITTLIDKYEEDITSINTYNYESLQWIQYK